MAARRAEMESGVPAEEEGCGMGAFVSWETVVAAVVRMWGREAERVERARIWVAAWESGGGGGEDIFFV